MSQGAAQFIGDIPNEYDRGLGPMIFVDYADDIVRRVAAPGPSRVLETAAGTGIVTRKLRSILPAGARLVATDLNPPMLEVACKKFGAGESVDFKPADATALPFPDGSFDAILCQFGIMFFPDKDKSYREAHRVLSAGGRYAFNVWDAHKHNPFARITHELLGRFFPADPPGFYAVPFGYHQLDPIKESLLAAGFRGLSATVLRLEKDVPDAAAFARGLICGNPVFDQILERGGAGHDEIIASLAAALRREFGADPGRMPLQAIVFEAHKM